EHALFVPDDDVRRLQFHQLLQPVVAVDDAAIEVVQVRRRETPAVERDERTQFRRNDRNHVEDHPLRLVRGAAERVDDLQALGVLELLLRRGLVAHLLAQFFGQPVDVHAAEHLLDGFRAHLGLELESEALALLAELVLREQLLFLQIRFAGVDDDVGLEVQDALEVAQRDVEQMSDAARQALEEPDVAHRRGECDVAEALAAHLRLRHLDAALVTDDASVLHALVLAAEALPVRDRAENLRAEQSVALRLERPVIDRLRLRDFAVRPLQDALRGGEADPDRVEIRRQLTFVVKVWSHYSVILVRSTSNYAPTGVGG